MTSIKTLGFAAVFATAMASAAHAGGYQFSPIVIPPPVGDLVYDPPYPDNAQALSINDNGQVLVSALDVSGTEPPGRQHVDFNDVYDIHTHTFTALPAFPGAVANSTLANGINDSGQIVGQYDPGVTTTPDGAGIAFLYSGGVYTTVNPFNDSDSNIFALAISNNGLITGADDNIDSMGNALSSQGFVGSGSLYTAFQVGSVPGTFTVGRGVNDSGTVAGYYGLPSGASGVFLYSGGAFTPINIPGAFYIDVAQMNDAGVVVGQVFFDSSFSIESGFIDNNGVITLLNFPGSPYTFIEGINNQGDIVGTYSVSADVQGAFLAVPVPEPATWALMLVGFGVAGARISQPQSDLSDMSNHIMLMSSLPSADVICNVIDIEHNSATVGTVLDAFTPKVTTASLVGTAAFAANQTWEIEPDPGGSSHHIITNPGSGLCIDIRGAVQTRGAVLQVYTARRNNNANQLWDFLPDPSGSGACFIQNPQTSLVIEIKDGSTAAGPGTRARPPATVRQSAATLDRPPSKPGRLSWNPTSVRKPADADDGPSVARRSG